MKSNKNKTRCTLKLSQFFGDADGSIVVSPDSRKCTQKNIFIYYIARLFSFKFLHVLASCLTFLSWLLCPRPTIAICYIVEALKSEMLWLIIMILLLRLTFLIYLLVKFGRAKPTCLKKNKEGLWEYAPSEMKAILKRQMFNIQGHSVRIFSVGGL